MWKSVKHYLPKDRTLVIATVIIGGKYEVLDRINYIDCEWYKCIIGAHPIALNRLYKEPKVIAWMYYPEPYKA